MSVRRMVNPVMPYAWGSRDGIAALQGRPPADGPEAELWMGAHEHASSLLEPADGRAGSARLGAAVAADPDAVLGERVVQRFGPRLPFLVKVLSAARPLSLQVHPDAERARAGFAEEEAAGIDRSAPNRCFRDPYAKPELLVALTPFEVLYGFADARAAALRLEGLGVARLAPTIEALRSGAPTGDAFLALLDWPAVDRAQLVGDVRNAAAAAAEAAAGAEAALLRWTCELADQYPQDPASVGALLLNYLQLAPGQAILVPCGQIHGYLLGTAIEVMGSSDNVVRAGLTSKHVALEELRGILARTATRPDVLEPVTGPDGGQRWPVPQPEFALVRYKVTEAREMAVEGPEILLCLDGTVEVAASPSRLALRAGESAFVSADSHSYALSGDGAVMRVTTGVGQPEATDTGPREPTPADRARHRRHVALEWLTFAVVTLVGTILIRTFVVQTYRIPSGSMEKTLIGCATGCHDDRILVNKLAYKLHGIHRGDIVVFKPSTPRWVAAVGSEDVVKRVIGLPGDTVQCCDAQGRVVRNGVPLNESYIYQDNHMAFGPVKVPDGELWVMGDHRSDSADSRYNGPIKKSDVIGHAFFRVWPLSRIGTF
jgi:mannose-6-phosphate isomerase